MNIELAPDEPLTPELVLVFPPKLRAQALARLGPPRWPAPDNRVAARPLDVNEPPARSTDESTALTLGVMLVARIGQLALVFAIVTIIVLVMSLVADAMR